MSDQHPARRLMLPMLLPAPPFDVAAHRAALIALIRDPRLLLRPESRVVLRREVDYHRPLAHWAAALLAALEHGDRSTLPPRRPRNRVITPRLPSSPRITYLHSEWQIEQAAALPDDFPAADDDDYDYTAALFHALMTGAAMPPRADPPSDAPPQSEQFEGRDPAPREPDRPRERPTAADPPGDVSPARPASSGSESGSTARPAH